MLHQLYEHVAASGEEGVLQCDLIHGITHVIPNDKVAYRYFDYLLGYGERAESDGIASSF
jgi:hypothetical protein